MKTTASSDKSMPLTEPLDMKIDIQGIYEPVIYEYFTRLNSGKFTATADLFAEEGCLKPPFDKQLQGRYEIAQYLEQEAKGIRFFPEHGEILINAIATSPLENRDRTRYQIQGKVEMQWFSIDTSWSIELNNAQEILLVDVKLLAALDELLSFSRG